MGGRTAEIVASKFSGNLASYLPKVQLSMNEFKSFKEKMEMKQKQDDHNDGGNKDTVFEVKSMKSMVNLLKAELDQQKKIFTPQKFNQIDKAHDLIKTLQMEIQLMKMDVD